jgi:hypothetical protein
MNKNIFTKQEKQIIWDKFQKCKGIFEKINDFPAELDVLFRVRCEDSKNPDVVTIVNYLTSSKEIDSKYKAMAMAMDKAHRYIKKLKLTVLPAITQVGEKVELKTEKDQQEVNSFEERFINKTLLYYKNQNKKIVIFNL